MFEIIITARLIKTKFRKMSVVQCYALTEDAELVRKKLFIMSLIERRTRYIKMILVIK